jgi:hypothetical protein
LKVAQLGAIVMATADHQSDSNLLVGPVLSVDGGYAFATWSADQGLTACRPYRRFEDARYGRTATMRDGSAQTVGFDTSGEFVAMIEQRATSVGARHP